MNLVSEYQEYGDVGENEISEVTIGEIAWVGFRYRSMIHDDTNHVFEQVEIRHDGTRVGLQQFEDEQLVDRTGMSLWEHALQFSTDDWSPGQHTAEVLIRDEVTDRVSEPESTEFSVVSEG